MCHNNFSVLEKLICLLDDARNDLYIHVDKKVKNFDTSKFLNSCRYSNVYFTEKRYNVKWGANSQVLAEMYLFKYAFSHSKERYLYYHLISGADLPLKNQEYMHKFFDSRDDIFLNRDDDRFVKRKYWRIGLYHFINPKIEKFMRNLQTKLNIDRIKKYNMTFYTGANWCSLPNYAVEYLLKKEKFIKKICRFSHCSDECYKHYVLFNSPLVGKIYRNKYGNPDNLRLVDWSRTNDIRHPHVYDMSDKELLINSEKMFARKFDESVCPQIIEFIYNFVKNS